MKNLYFYLLVIVIISTLSCRSIEKLVDKGRYDDAIDLAFNRLNANNLKTKQIIALERGFERMNSRDLKQIAYLKNSHSDYKWDDIYSIISNIENRQFKLDMLLPIESKEGYVAHFAFVDTDEMKSIAATNAADFHYRSARDLLAKYDSTFNKSLARAAFDEAVFTQDFVPNYEDIKDLKERAFRDGISNVLIKWDQTSIDNMPRDFLSIAEMAYRDVENGFWVKFYNSFKEGLVFDAIVQIAIGEINISPEREEVLSKEELRTFLDPVDPARFPDSSSQQEVQYVESKEKVLITEVRRIKEVYLSGWLELRDYESGSLLRSDNYEIAERFESSAFEEHLYNEGFSGPVRNGYPVRRGALQAFPSDFNMLYQVTEKLNKKFKNFARSIDVI